MRDPAPRAQGAATWTVGANEAGWLSEVRYENGWTVCSCEGRMEEAEANAALIAAAPALLAACQAALPILEHARSGDHTGDHDVGMCDECAASEALATVRAALAQARRESEVTP